MLKLPGMPHNLFLRITDVCSLRSPNRHRDADPVRLALALLSFTAGRSLAPWTGFL